MKAPLTYSMLAAASLLSSVALVHALGDEDFGPLLHLSQYPESVRSRDKFNPSTKYIPPGPIPESDFQIITFFDSDKCHGGGSQGAIVVKANEFSDTFWSVNPPEDTGMSHFVRLGEEWSLVFDNG
ncbi:hypothetical protein K469DRAFT_693453 [Zopfia rhizophila CBS 207.26]|uniref:Uncharacterized protein n=1 Tax=Zopfia rhizophila CBS 207.26 TaxID=1314779 RepID=A0A6A6DRP1_9PEZI|nr:hypothetical protein K469DRAFT_693453 [Zopfia rhizophila CBS 207.26]